MTTKAITPKGEPGSSGQAEHLHEAVKLAQARRLPALLDSPVVQVAISRLRVHPLAEKMPRMPHEQFIVFCQDFGKQVLHELLIDREHRILDGRHRFEAAQQNGHTQVPCRMVDCSEEEAVDLIYREALLRRHLSDDQRAALAAEWYQYASQKAKEDRARKGGRTAGRGRAKKTESSQDDASHKQTAPSTRAQAAAKFNVSEGKVRKAIDLKEKAPDLVEEVKEGELTLAEANRQHATQQAETALTSPPEGEAADNAAEAVAPQPKSSRTSHVMLTLTESDEKLARTLRNVLGLERAIRLGSLLQQSADDAPTPAAS